MKAILAPIRILLPLAVALLGLAPAAVPDARAQGPEAALEAARQIFYDGKYEDAVKALEQVVKDYATNAINYEARLRLGYAYFVTKKYDEANKTLKDLLGPPTPEGVQEEAFSIIPQITAAQASGVPEKDEKRKQLFTQAIKEFTDFLKKYGNSKEFEGALYGRALAQFQIQEFDKAVEDLRLNIGRFAKSPTIIDSRYLLALTLSTQATVELQKETPDRAAASKLFDEAEAILREIVNDKNDLSLSSDAAFQLGDTLMNRATLTDDQAEANKLYDRAIEVFRGIQPKPLLLKVQSDRMEYFKAQVKQAYMAKRQDLLPLIRKQIDREQRKMAALEQKPDQSLAAKLKIGEVYYRQAPRDTPKWNYLRTLMSFLKPFSESLPQEKKKILYYTTLSYAAQNRAELAIENYNAFQAEFKGDPLAENLPIFVGNMFLSSENQSFEKALAYFEEARKLYPTGRLAALNTLQTANTLVGLSKFDDALKLYDEFLKTNPKPNLAAQAVFGSGQCHEQMKRFDQAIAAFDRVRKEFAETADAEPAFFRIGLVNLLKGDGKTAIQELTAFLEKYKESPIRPPAMFTLAQANQAIGQNEEALKIFKETAEKFPQHEVASFSLLQSAQILAQLARNDEMVAVLQKFIETYPDDPNLFAAFDSIGNEMVRTSKRPEAIANYEKFVERRPNDKVNTPNALLKISNFSLQDVDDQGRYQALNEERRQVWSTAVERAAATADRIIHEFPTSDQMNGALQNAMRTLTLQVDAELKTEETLEAHFQEVAGEFQEQPQIRSKILFTLAARVGRLDPERAFQIMKEAYLPDVKYTPSDLEMYALALLAAKQPDDAAAVFDKLAKDYPVPEGTDPKQAQLDIQIAQAAVLFGRGRVAQEKGQTKEAFDFFSQLKTAFPWSDKVAEADLGIAESLLAQKQHDQALALLGPIMRSTVAANSLRARAMLLGGKIEKDRAQREKALTDYFMRLPAFFPGETLAAAEAHWEIGQLSEALSNEAADPNQKTSLNRQARASYAEITQHYAKSPFGPKAEERLQALGGPPSAK